MADLIARLKAWCDRRYWQRRHMEFVRNMVNEDWRWLGANPIADELTTRYRAALSADWFKRQHEPVSHFRERLCKRLGANTFSVGAPGNAGVLVPLALPVSDHAAKGWYAAIVDAQHVARKAGNGWLADKLVEIHHHLIDTDGVETSRAPRRWVERWHGSGPDRGWWIWEADHGDKIAYIGEGEFAERLTGLIVEKHNSALGVRVPPPSVPDQT